MERIAAALLAGIFIGFGFYAGAVLIVLMAKVVPIWALGVAAGAGFILSILYDIATTTPAEPPSER